MTQLTKEQTMQIRDAFFTLIDTSSKRRATLVQSGKMKETESLTIAGFENNLQKLADEFNQTLLDKIVEDIEAPSQKILTATGNLNTTINKLVSLNQFIGLLSKVINGISTVITAIQSGNPLKLAGLLNMIESLNA